MENTLDKVEGYENILRESGFICAPGNNTKLLNAIRYDGRNKDRIEVVDYEWSHYLSINIDSKDLIARGKNLKSLKKHLKTL